MITVFLFLIKIEPMKLVTFLLYILVVNGVFSQQTINGTIQHGGLTREYILYVPASYQSGIAVPLVFNFHGYTSNATEQMNYANFRPIADTANFIIVHPMGTNDGSGQPFWNAGWGGTVDDIGFTQALIDTLSGQYSINQNRIYSTGMSNGGFMSYGLACSLSNRFAAIASVTGSMNYSQSLSCSPQHPIPVMQIHGTADATVPYNGILNYMDSISKVLRYWVNFNNCDVIPTVTQVPNTNLTDGSTAEHFIYSNGNNGVEVEHFKVIGGGHTWPGSPFIIGVTNQDFNACKEIWRFFSKYDLNGKILGVEPLEQTPIVVYPNPVEEIFQIDGINALESIELLDIAGNKVPFSLESPKEVNVSGLKSGIYFCQLKTGNQAVSIKFVKL
jgi:polyhydroxybutyrate depolymerase